MWESGTVWKRLCSGKKKYKKTWTDETLDKEDGPYEKDTDLFERRGSPTPSYNTDVTE